jgi:hypothetical protein
LEYRPWVDAYDAVFIEMHGDTKPPQRRYILGPALEYFINYLLVAPHLELGGWAWDGLRWIGMN